MLREIPLAEGEPAAALEQVMRSAGKHDADDRHNVRRSSSRSSRPYWMQKKSFHLLDLPLAYANGARVRDLRLRADGTPDLADASLEDAQ